VENALREPWSNNSSDPTQGESGRSMKSGQTAGNSGHGSQVNQSNPIWLSDELEFWPDPSKNLKFVAIAAMHSELIAVGANGLLYQWKWIDVEPYKHPEVT